MPPTLQQAPRWSPILPTTQLQRAIGEDVPRRGIDRHGLIRRHSLDHVSFRDSAKLASIHLIDQELPPHAHLSKGLKMTCLLDSTCLNQTRSATLVPDPSRGNHNERALPTPNAWSLGRATPEQTRRTPTGCGSPILPLLPSKPGSATPIQSPVPASRATSLPPAGKFKGVSLAVGVKSLLTTVEALSPDLTLSRSGRAASVPPAPPAARPDTPHQTPRSGRRDVKAQPAPAAPGSTLPRPSAGPRAASREGVKAAPELTLHHPVALSMLVA